MLALKLGKQIKKNCPDVKVIYTRDRDIFIPLDRRAEIANNAKADLFISIHTNALAKNRTAKGASTWTLGLAKSDANLEVAKREKCRYPLRKRLQDAVCRLQSQLGRVLHHLRIHARQIHVTECAPRLPRTKAFPPNLQTYRSGRAPGRFSRY